MVLVVSLVNYSGTLLPLFHRVELVHIDDHEIHRPFMCTLLARPSTMELLLKGALILIDCKYHQSAWELESP